MLSLTLLNLHPTNYLLFRAGDVMGSALSDLDKLLALPTGCGEQNMLKFAPNIYVLEYLIQTNQLTDKIKEKAVGFLQTGIVIGNSTMTSNVCGNFKRVLRWQERSRRVKSSFI